MKCDQTIVNKYKYINIYTFPTKVLYFILLQTDLVFWVKGEGLGRFIVFLPRSSSGGCFSTKT